MTAQQNVERLLSSNAEVIRKLEADEERLGPQAEEWMSFRSDPRDYASACEFLRLGKAGMERSGIQARLADAYRERYDLVKRRHPDLFPRRRPLGTAVAALLLVGSCVFFFCHFAHWGAVDSSGSTRKALHSSPI